VNVAALFVRRDSHYKTLDGVDCYDEDRDALTWPGGVPGIFHPPCRGWGKLSGFAKCAPGELALAVWSVAMCRRFGGVVEHPVHSRLWKEVGCWSAGMRDNHGGVFITLNQADFGHRAEKATGLYIVGAPVPSLPFFLADASHSVERMNVKEREQTPPQFAALLVHLARQAHPWAQSLEMAA
jgi:hypothetical protein